MSYLFSVCYIIDLTIQISFLPSLLHRMLKQTNFRVIYSIAEESITEWSLRSTSAMKYLAGDKPIWSLSIIPAHFFRVKHTHTCLLFSVLMNRNLRAFISNSLQKALPSLILNKVDFTSHLKRQDSSRHSHVFWGYESQPSNSFLLTCLSEGLLKWFTATIKKLS